MKIKYYKTNLGVIFNCKYSQLSAINSSFRFNDFKQCEEVSAGWFLLRDEKDIQKVYKMGVPQLVNPRWELKDDSIVSESIPLQYSCEDVGEYYDEDEYYWYWNNHKSFRPLYDRITDSIKGEWEPVDFELELLSEVFIDNYEEPTKLVYKIHKEDNYGSNETSISLPQQINGYWGITTDELTKILVPSVFWHFHPCFLSAQHSYNLIRAYVKENIDGRYAAITSDYNFCFTVVKRIPIKPYVNKTPILKRCGRPYAKPRFKTSTVTHKEEIIFEMAPKPYQSYPVIKGFYGETLKDLKENIDLYLQELIETINSPVVECNHCKGVGAIVENIELPSKE